ncbi:LysE family translocator [Maritalea sp.]|uniref:LysE family translocator n=1 Tax=Maritalea sp. TaxID=2003361 RepID=UPI003EF71989
MSYVLPLVLFLIPLAFSPGPGNLFFAALSARFGAAASIPALAGYHVGTMVITFLVGLGFEIGTSNNAGFTKFLASVGAIYVLYLAFKLATSKISDAPDVQNVPSFMDGFLLLAFNPKAYVIIALLFTQFPTAKLLPENPMLANLMISSFFTVHNLFAFIVWILVSDRLAKGFRSRQNFQRMNWLFGGMLGVVAVWLFVTNWI